MSLRDAVLWAPHPALLEERAAGLTVLQRQLFLLRRAGFERVWVGAGAPAGFERLRRPEGLDVSWAPSPAPGGPHLHVSGDHLIRLSALKAAAAEPPSSPVIWKDATGRAVLRLVVPGDPATIAQARPAERALSAEDCLVLTSPVAAGPAEAWLIRQAVKGTDGFMARHFDRHISLAATRRLLDTRVTPNMMTVLSSSVGIAGAVLLAPGSWAASLCGTLLIWLHSTLDGCDGELARLRFEESPLGGVLDFWGDNLVHAALFICLGVGEARRAEAAWPFALGLVAAASATASAGLAFLHSRRTAAARGQGPFFAGVADAGPSEAERRLVALENSLAQRDFVYLLPLLAAAGRLRWFLWAAAVGSPAYHAVLLWLGRRRTA